MPILLAGSNIGSTEIGSIGLDCMGGGLGLGLGTPAKLHNKIKRINHRIIFLFVPPYRSVNTMILNVFHKKITLASHSRNTVL